MLVAYSKDLCKEIDDKDKLSRKIGDEVYNVCNQTESIIRLKLYVYEPQGFGAASVRKYRNSVSGK